MYLAIACGFVTLGSVITLCHKRLLTNCIKHLFLPRSLEQIDKYTYIVSYSHKGQQYKLLMPIKRGPKKIIRIYDDQQNDVTEQVKPFLGPNEDFHKTSITPSFINYEELHFHTRDTVYSFSADETITL